MNNLNELLPKSEYEVQLFSTSSFCVIQQLKSLTLHDVKVVTDVLQKKIVGRCSAPDEIEKCEHLIKRLRAEYEAAVHKCFAEMEPEISNIFNIPSHVLLPEDEVQKEQYTDDDLHKIDEEIRMLKSRCRRAVCMKSLLEKEKKIIPDADIIEHEAMEVEESITTLENIVKKGSVLFLSNELSDLKNLVQRICSFSDCSEETINDYLDEKLFGRVV